jgi:polyphosphate kinase
MYVRHFPAAGQVVIFDAAGTTGGWRAGHGFLLTGGDRAVPGTRASWVKAMTDSGILLLKYWLEVSSEEQTRRLESRITDRRKIWKLSAMDLESCCR